MRRSPRCRRKDSSCAARSRPRPRPRTNGANGGCWRASIATRSSGCAPRSSRSRRATSCASCSSGSASRRVRAWRARMRSARCWRSSKASRRRRAPGRPSCCPPASASTSRPGSMSCASPGASCGRAWRRVAAAASVAPRRCAPRRSCCWRGATCACGRRSPAAARARCSRPPRSAPPRTWRSTAPRSSTRSSPAPACCRAQAEEALAELVALGLVNSDSFAGLRALLVPADRRRPALGGRRRRRLALFGMDAAGRWSRIARPVAAATPDAAARALAEETVEHVVRTLLRR